MVKAESRSGINVVLCNYYLTQREISRFPYFLVFIYGRWYFLVKVNHLFLWLVQQLKSKGFRNSV